MTVRGAAFPGAPLGPTPLAATQDNGLKGC
jgi:hypothetical protein